MSEKKSPLSSVTVWAGLLVLLWGVLAACGVQVSDEIKDVTGQQVVPGLLTAALGLLTIWGRVRATKVLNTPSPEDKTPKLLFLLLLLPVMWGCTIVTARDRTYFDQSAANAAAFNARIQPMLAPAPNDWSAVKLWIQSQADKTKYESDWAHGRRPAVPPGP